MFLKIIFCNHLWPGRAKLLKSLYHSDLIIMTFIFVGVQLGLIHLR
jgi:hypothetical protein